MGLADSIVAGNPALLLLRHLTPVYQEVSVPTQVQLIMLCEPGCIAVATSDDAGSTMVSGCCLAKYRSDLSNHDKPSMSSCNTTQRLFVHTLLVLVMREC